MVRKVKSMFAFICLVLALVFTLELIAKVTVLDEYLSVKDRKVSLIFLYTNECLGCNRTVMSCFNLLNSEIDSDVYAVVNARRQIELKKFSKLFRWKKETILYKEEMRKKFNIKDDCLVVVFDNEGNKLEEVSRFDKEAFSKIAKLYKKENK